MGYRAPTALLETLKTVHSPNNVHLFIILAFFIAVC